MNYQGKHASCEVMIDDIDQSTVQQIYGFLNCEVFAGSQIRIMPDVHAGIGSVIGFTATLGKKIIPNVVGVDIGCGIASYCLGRGMPLDFDALDKHVRESVPSGFSVHDARPKFPGLAEDLISQVVRVARETEQDEARVLRSLGTLGGGNHFIELGKDGDKRVWLTIHTGSRNFGLKVAEYHQGMASRKPGKGDVLAYLEGEEAALYYEHMKVAQEYALLNRVLIARALVGFFMAEARDDWEHMQIEKVESIHNYIDFDDRIIRKGAIAAHEGQRVVIPWNMRDGLIIGRGKGNANWNWSAPHGAGRVMSRGAARKKLDVADFEKTMKGIWTSCVGKATLDEAPMVYKDAETIRQAIGDTVDVELTVKPLYNFKASDQ